MKSKLTYFLMAMLAGCCAAAAQTNVNSVVNLDSFKLIEQRNIFDPSRSGKIPSRYGRTRKATVVDIFGLSGASVAPSNHSIAIFEGYGIPPVKEFHISDVINGYRLIRIDFDSIRLIAPNAQNLTLRVQNGLRREDKGPWKVTDTFDVAPTPAPVTTDQSSTSPPTSASTATSSDDTAPVSDNGPADPGNSDGTANAGGTGRSGGGRVNPAGKAREEEILKRLRQKAQNDQ